MGAYTTAQYDALKAAIATGALEVRYADGRTVKYRSLQEMQQILDSISAELGIVPKKTNFSLAGYRRG